MNLNALNPVQDINSVIEQINNSGYDVRPELFYDKQLLDTIRLDADQFIYYRLAETKAIQNNAEKLQVRRWAPLQAHTVPLDEGVPPFSDKGSMEAYEIPTFQYGRYMEFTDKVDFEIIDPMIAHYTNEYSIVALETLDLLAQDALLTVAQAAYANAKANFQSLTIGDTGSINDLRIITNSMKKQLVKPRNGGRFHVIAGPDFYFDMISDPLVEKYMTINNTTKGFYDVGAGPIPPMFGMEFYETLAAPVGGEYTSGGDDYLLVYRFNTDTEEYETDSLDAATYKKKVTNQVDATNTNGAYIVDERTGHLASYVPGLTYWDIDAYNATAAADGFGDFAPLNVATVMVVGADALVRTEIAGQGNAKMYVKPKGSSGVLDPIDQRQSIGFKINSVGFGSTRPEAVVAYYCVPTQSNI